MVSKTLVGCHTVYSLRSVVDYFVDNGSTVNLCSLDVSKAFDKINHFVLFSKLMVSNVPINLIKLLSTWYSNSTSIVNWYGAVSESYKLRAGVRQGGVLSPVLFAKYVDIVITTIDDSMMGCQISSLSMGILMYADDLVLNSASVSKLQNMEKNLQKIFFQKIFLNPLA